MINQLAGTILELTENNLVIDVNGVGYELEVSLNTIAKLPSIGATVIVKSYLAVREDALKLYGFIDVEEKNCFMLLLKVSGIGPKNSLAIVSNITPNNLYLAIAKKDIVKLTTLPGIGKKTAERISLELQDKIPKNITVTTEATTIDIAKSGLSKQVSSALVALGYKSKDAQNLANKIISSSDETTDVQTLVKKALLSK